MLKQALTAILLVILACLAPAGQASAAASGEFRLKGVLISPTNRSALINNSVAKVGDSVAGAEILAIEDGNVLILKGTTKLIVQVGSTAAHGSPVGPLVAKSLQPAAGQYRVRSGDTLSAIAEQYAGEGASLNQVMSALFDANPDAFDGNINRLRAGSVLRVPQQRELAGRSHRMATALIMQHQSEWKPGVKIQEIEPNLANLREYGPVRRGETLSGIALRVKDDGVSMYRMMTALYDANPQAFRGDMDFLREGATLDIPAVGGNYEQLAAAVR